MIASGGGRSLVVALCRALLAVFLFVAPAAANPFPLYECIRPNVAFWKDIYAKYPSSQGVLHDANDLSVVYEVIDLEPELGNAARERNNNRIKDAKAHYEGVLLRLADGNPPENAEERRVLALFGPRVDSLRLRQAATAIRFQLGQKDRFLEGVIRSGAYLGQIKEILRSYGLPEDLAYLPHVESSFNYKAYSKFGAAGIWQFTRETGQRFLAIDYSVDERRDPIRATHAAARLLKENFEKLGSWPLAVTAYNHGVNGMRRAREEKGDYEAIFREYESGLFKFASRNFYSEFLAACEVAKNYRAYFGDIPLLPPVACHEVTLKGNMPIARLLNHFKLDKETFQRFNPGLREPIYLGEKCIPQGYQVHLPTSKEMTRLAGHISEDLYQKGQKQSRIYRVRRGDTVSAIARRQHVSVQDLLAANRLGKRAAIFVGQNLRIPQQDEAPVVAAVKPRTEKRLASLTPQVPPVEMVAEAAPTAARVRMAIVPRVSTSPEPATASTTAVPVRITQLEMPAQKPGADRDIAGNAQGKGAQDSEVAEPLSSAALANPAVVTEQFDVERIYAKKGKKFAIIRVAPEETMGHYAEWLGMPIPELRRLNHLSADQEIRMGQRITIPLDGVGRERFEELRYEFHREMEEDFFAVYRVDRVRRYQVKPGDNIWRLCQYEFDVPLWLVRKYNADSDVTNLKPGKQLLVPVVEKKS